MAVPFLDLRRQYSGISAEIMVAVQGVVESQSFILGPEVAAFEEEIAGYVGSSHAIGVASGTDALLLPLKALNASPGSEVILPAFTFFATAGAVWNAGLKPVFCDVDSATFNLTAETVDAAWTDRTVAVVPVHLFGQLAPMKQIAELVHSRGAFVLEDAAQAIGARSDDGAAGTLGDAAAFSFFPTKNLGAFGDGGLVTCNDPGFAELVRKARVHGGRKMYHHETVGTNSRLDALQAAILRVKLPHLDRWASMRRENAAVYRQFLDGVGGLQLPVVPGGHSPVYNQFTVTVDRRDDLRAYLSEKGIGTGVYYPVPLHLQDCFSSLGYSEGDLPVSEALSRSVLSLPIFPELTREEIETVCETVVSFFGIAGM